MTLPKNKRTVDVHDQVELVDKIVAATDAINLAETAIAEARQELDAQVSNLRRTASYGGVLINTIHARGSNRSVTYCFKEQYSSTSVVAETAMRRELGDLYDRLLERKVTAKIKDGALSQIRALLGDKYKDLIEETETVTPKPEFRQNLHELRQQLPVDKAEVLDEYEVKFCYRPSLKVNS